MGNIRFLLPDILGTQSAEVVADSEASASLADDNLLTPEPWQKWRSAGVNPGQCSIYAGVAGRPYFPLDGVALAGLNMVPGNGEVMTLLADTGFLGPIYSVRLPTSIVASNAITGVVTDVDEGIAAATDSAYIEPTTTTGSFVTFALQDPGSPPRTGARRQAFVLRVCASADTSGVNASTRPTITVNLYENVAGVSTFRANLGTKAVHGTAQHLLFFSWDAALLATASGVDVQARVEFTTISGVVKAQLDAIEWQCESGHITSFPEVKAESGWMTIIPEALSGLGYDYASQVGDHYTRWSYKFDQIYSNANRVYVFLREDHVPAETATSINRFLLRPPPGYVQCGKLAAGLWWSPAVNRATGQFATVDDRSTKLEDAGGGEWGSREEPGDIFRIRLEYLTAQELAWLKRRLLYEMGTLAPYFVEIEPDAEADHGFELGFGGWVTTLSPQNAIEAQNLETFAYSLEFTVRVKR